MAVSTMAPTGSSPVSMSLFPVAAIFADGGVIGLNPSRIGGTWAWRAVDAHGLPVAQGSGVHAWDGSGPGVTNNLTEYLALLHGLESLPEGWSGQVCSDSKITLGRFFWGWKITGVPQPFVARGAAVLARLRVDQCTPVLLDGHPTRRQLAAGVGKRGHPVSIHNVFCDQECQRLAREAPRVVAVGAR
jgi:hypothetical protein